MFLSERELVNASPDRQAVLTQRDSCVLRIPAGFHSWCSGPAWDAYRPQTLLLQLSFSSCTDGRNKQSVLYVPIFFSIVSFSGIKKQSSQKIGMRKPSAFNGTGKESTENQKTLQDVSREISQTMAHLILILSTLFLIDSPQWKFVTYLHCLINLCCVVYRHRESVNVIGTC